MMLHRHFEKRKPVKPKKDMDVKEGEDMMLEERQPEPKEQPKRRKRKE